MSFFFFSSRRRHTRFDCDWSSDVCSSDLDRFRHGARADHESEAVLADERRRGGGDPFREELRLGVDEAAAKAVEIPRKTREAVRVHAAQIGAHQARGDGRGVLLRHAVRGEQRPRKRVGLLVPDEYAPAHRSAISCTCFARAVDSASRNARSVPVDTYRAPIFTNSATSLGRVARPPTPTYLPCFLQAAILRALSIASAVSN